MRRVGTCRPPLAWNRARLRSPSGFSTTNTSSRPTPATSCSTCPAATTRRCRRWPRPPARLAFAEAYQSTHALTIGELWAYPQMLRLALVENIQALAANALTELREREIAGFWANRLITIGRHDHHRLFAIMAELTAARPAPSPYFASQLIDHLYDEEAVLVPVQGWLERVYRKPLVELNLREQNRQTQDQVSISNAFPRLRQLALLDWRQIFEDLSAVERVLRSDPAGVYASMDFEARR